MYIKFADMFGQFYRFKTDLTNFLPVVCFFFQTGPSICYQSDSILITMKKKTQGVKRLCRRTNKTTQG